MKREKEEEEEEEEKKVKKIKWTTHYFDHNFPHVKHYDLSGAHANEVDVVTKPNHISWRNMRNPLKSRLLKMGATQNYIERLNIMSIEDHILVRLHLDEEIYLFVEYSPIFPHESKKYPLPVQIQARQKNDENCTEALVFFRRFIHECVHNARDHEAFIDCVNILLEERPLNPVAHAPLSSIDHILNNMIGSCTKTKSLRQKFARIARMVKIWLKYASERRNEMYKPGGTGYKLSKENFDQLSFEQSKSLSV